MNRYLSLMELQFKERAKSVLLVIAGLIIANVAMFNLVGIKASKTFAESYNSAHLNIVLLIGYLLMIMVLVGRVNKNSDTEIRLNMLRVSNRECWYIESFVNFVYITMCYFVEIAVILGLMFEFRAKGIDIAGDVGVFSDLYKLEIVYSIMPIGAGIVWVKNIFCLISLSMALALLRTPKVSGFIIFVTIFPAAISTGLLRFGINSAGGTVPSIMVQTCIVATIVFILVIKETTRNRKNEKEEVR